MTGPLDAGNHTRPLWRWRHTGDGRPGSGLDFWRDGAIFAVCLRAASVEVAKGMLGPRLYIWLIAFTAAVASVQALITAGWLASWLAGRVHIPPVGNDR